MVFRHKVFVFFSLAIYFSCIPANAAQSEHSKLQNDFSNKRKLQPVFAEPDDFGDSKKVTEAIQKMEDSCRSLPKDRDGRQECVDYCEKARLKLATGNIEDRRTGWYFCMLDQGKAFGMEPNWWQNYPKETVKINDIVWCQSRGEKYRYTGQVLELADNNVLISQVSLDRTVQKSQKWFEYDQIETIKAPVLVEVWKGQNGVFYQAEITAVGANNDAQVNYTDRLPKGLQEIDTRECTVRKRHDIKFYQDNVYLWTVRTYDGIEADRKNSISLMEDPCKREMMFNQQCPAVSPSLKTEQYGEAMFRTSNLCFPRYFTKTEQFFLGGFSSAIMNRCKYSPQDKSQITPFLESIWITANLGGPAYASSDLPEALAQSSVSTAALYTGLKMAEAFGCSKESKYIVDGFVRYLSHTSSKTTGGRQFADTCARHYNGQYSQEQCQCVADLARAVIPEIHASEFSPEIIRDIISRNPFLGAPIVAQCGIIKY